MPAVEPQRLRWVINGDGPGGLGLNIGWRKHEARVDTIFLGLARQSERALSYRVVLCLEDERNIISSSDTSKLGRVEYEATSTDFDLMDRGMDSDSREKSKSDNLDRNHFYR